MRYIQCLDYLYTIEIVDNAQPCVKALWYIDIKECDLVVTICGEINIHIMSLKMLSKNIYDTLRCTIYKINNTDGQKKHVKSLSTYT